jgi:hypothetical protein
MYGCTIGDAQPGHVMHHAEESGGQTAELDPRVFRQGEAVAARPRGSAAVRGVRSRRKRAEGVVTVRNPNRVTVPGPAPGLAARAIQATGCRGGATAGPESQIATMPRDA